MKNVSERRSVFIALIVYVALVSVLALTHDMWRDEVRAFSVATRAGSWGQMFADLGEEGHPFVWYALLRAGYAVTGSTLVLPVTALVAAVAAAYLILRYAPYPLWARVAAVFGVFMAHEVSVVARNYGIGVLLLALACALFPHRERQGLQLAMVLAVLANTSVHAAAATALLLGLWFLDLAGRETRAAIGTGTIAGWAVAAGGIVVALITARPPGEMAYAFSLSQLNPAAVASVVFADPGLSLRGTNGADLVASGAIPWARFGLDANVVSRVLVNVGVLSVAWSLRRHARVLVAFVIAVLGFAIIFRLVYMAALRHEAMLFFVIIALCWIAIDETPQADRVAARRRIALGLLPMLMVPAVAMPFTAWRGLTKPESMAPALARAIASRPIYADAILMSEPEPHMETMPYYVKNDVYMPRQREFDYRAFFDSGSRRQLVMSIAGLAAIADSVSCATGRPVLLSIGHRRFLLENEGTAQGSYKAVFTWTSAEKAAFSERTSALPWFPGATGDENYRTFEIRAGKGSCKSPGAGGQFPADTP